MTPEQVLFEYLENSHIVDAPVWTEVPEDPPARFVVFERTGSRSPEQRLGAVTFTVKSTAPTLYEAVTLNENVKEALRQMPDHADVYGVEIQSDYNSTDTRTKQHRYTTVVIIYCPQ